MQRDLQFLLDMLQSAELFMNYTAQCSKDEFVGNVQLQDSVIRRLLVIAEAASVDLNIVWDVIQTEIPTLRVEGFFHSLQIALVGRLVPVQSWFQPLKSLLQTTTIYHSDAESRFGANGRA